MNAAFQFNTNDSPCESLQASPAFLFTKALPNKPLNVKLVSEEIHPLKLCSSILLTVLLQWNLRHPTHMLEYKASYFTRDGQHTELMLTQFLKERTGKT